MNRCRDLRRGLFENLGRPKSYDYIATDFAFRFEGPAPNTARMRFFNVVRPPVYAVLRLKSHAVKRCLGKSTDGEKVSSHFRSTARPALPRYCTYGLEVTGDPRFKECRAVSDRARFEVCRNSSHVGRNVPAPRASQGSQPTNVGGLLIIFYAKVTLCEETLDENLARNFRAQWRQCPGSLFVSLSGAED